MRRTYEAIKGLSRCEFCLRAGMLSSCNRCKDANYCSQACQRKDWPSHHSHCAAFKEPDPQDFNECLEYWISRIDSHLKYLTRQTSETCGRSRYDMVLYVTADFNAETCLFRIDEVESRHISELEPAPDDHVGNGNYYAIVECNEIKKWVPITLRPEENEINSEAFFDIDACIRSMNDANAHLRRSKMVRHFKMDLNRLKGQCKSDYVDFIWNAFNMGTMFPLNKSHCILLKVKTEMGSVDEFESFELKTIEQMVNITRGSIDTDPNRISLQCVFFEPREFHFRDAIRCDKPPPLTPTCTVAESQKAARQLLKQLDLFWSTP